MRLSPRLRAGSDAYPGRTQNFDVHLRLDLWLPRMRFKFLTNWPAGALWKWRLPPSVLTLIFLARRPSSDGDNDIGVIRCANVRALSGIVMTNAISVVFRPAAQSLLIRVLPFVEIKTSWVRLGFTGACGGQTLICPSHRT